MKLLVKNFGSICNNTQTIDLSKKFYVFVGNNNSGKTYISQLLWAIFNQEVIKKFARSVQLEILPIIIQDQVHISQDLVNNILSEYEVFLKEEVTNIFNVQSTYFASNLEISFQLNGLEEFKKRKYQGNFLVNNKDYKDLDYLVVNKPIDSFSINFEQKTVPADFFDLFPRKGFEEELKLEIQRCLILCIMHLLLNHEYQTFFVPSTRQFYPIFYKYIYDIERKRREEDMKKIMSLIEHNNRENQDEINQDYLQELNLFKRPYTEPMNYVLEKLYALNQNLEIVPHYPNIIEKLIEIMGGNIVLKSLEGISEIEFYFRFSKEHLDLPMHLTSSSVNQLTLLYLYLKYWAAEKNNFLTLDEPEENLHPENQVKLVDLLIQFAIQKDNKVLVTTHSPLLANAVNNYIYLDVLKNEYNGNFIEKIVEENGLKYVYTDNSISQDDIGVYFFDGSRIIDYEADEYGVYFRNFREIIDSLDKTRKILTDYIYLKETGDE